MSNLARFENGAADDRQIITALQSNVKALFVTHDYGAYGASKSLQLLLKNNPKLDISLVIPKKEILTLEKRCQIAKFYGIGTDKVKQFFLPWNNCFEGRKTDFKNGIIQAAKNILWKFNKHQFYQFIRESQFDFIHLNSIVLSDVVVKFYPFIIHVREFLTESSNILFHKIHQAKGIIFIDESVIEPFMSYRLNNELILNNPVDMTGVGKYIDTDALNGDCATISIIGRIVKHKGIDFIIKSFKKAQSDGLRLFIVGDEGDGMRTGYPAFCREIASEDQRIIFWGREPDINKIYAISDYIIRGEVDFRMGRSVLEALYSDCDVIVPIRNDHIVKTNEELTKFKSKVHTYLPRDMGSLTKTFLNLSGRKTQKRNFHSNINGYVKTFNEYISNIL